MHSYFCPQVVCEHCNGPFHGTCLEPALYEVPEEDWVCPVCTAHMVEGVYDCPSADLGAGRIESLGVDRQVSWIVANKNVLYFLFLHLQILFNAIFKLFIHL